jgi:hypothetical protein
MVRKFLLPMLIVAAFLWPANSVPTSPTFDSGFDYQLFPHFNPYGPGHFEGPFQRDHKHHKDHRSFNHGSVSDDRGGGHGR